MANGNIAYQPNTRLYWTFGQFQQDLIALGDQLAQIKASVPGITEAIDKLRASGDRRLEEIIAQLGRLLSDIDESIENLQGSLEGRLDSLTGEVKRIANAAERGRDDDDRTRDDDRLSHLLAWGITYPSHDVDAGHPFGAVLHDAGYPTVRRLAGRSKSPEAAAEQLEQDIRAAHPNFDISRGLAARIVAAARAIGRKTAP